MIYCDMKLAIVSRVTCNRSFVNSTRKNKRLRINNSRSRIWYCQSLSLSRSSPSVSIIREFIYERDTIRKPTCAWKKYQRSRAMRPLMQRIRKFTKRTARRRNCFHRGIYILKEARTTPLSFSLVWRNEKTRNCKFSKKSLRRTLNPKKAEE